MRLCDVDLVNRTIRTPDEASVFVRQRTVPIDDDWCWRALRDRFVSLRAAGAAWDGWLVYQGDQPDPKRRNPACSQLVTDALKRAGLYKRGVSRIASITEWVAISTYTRTGDMERVANLLGMSSLDAAHLVGHDWVEETVPPVRQARRVHGNRRNTR